MLSILIPTYNYNVEALVSELHAQTTACDIEFEILCYDDGSTNLELIEENKSIELLTHTTYKVLDVNIGRSAIRNLLAKDAKHDLLLFLDADVIPVNDDFISKYITVFTESTQLIFGGVNYQDKKPNNEEMLRWVFGRKREVVSLEERKKSVYLSFLSCNFIIKKEIFTSVNFNEDISLDAHEDLLFSFNLKENNISISHINNPIYHLGLENSKIYLKKSLKGVKASLSLAKDNLIHIEYTRIIRTFHKCKKTGINFILAMMFPVFKNSFETNLLSKKPSLFIFDLYKLSYLCYISKNE
ncbi:MAG: glycosyltransferase [Formosa sp.]|jgi:cellulose synthase/poly-beta-1,6-N-acetylglucosamine synthase-like glycosyltransferase|nr:glycosyltransferase [Formosa sp.]